jgi:CRP-like cAMP-binding protein
VKSASIIADEPSVLYQLTREALTRLEAEDPLVAAAFHKMITLILAERLADTTDSLLHYLE